MIGDPQMSVHLSAHMVRGRRAVPVVLALAAALLAGCAKRDSITVGSVPDDYRTNHPIVVEEREQVLDFPVGKSAHSMTSAQKATLDGFLAEYDRRAAPVVSVMIPAGSVNEAAARRVAEDFVAFMSRTGIPRQRIVLQSYGVESYDAAAPIRVSYPDMRAAVAGKCGRWPDDILNHAENKHYANFGCSYQNNLAAQVANPGDFLGPRRRTEVDAEKRSAVIDTYQTTVTEWEPEVEY